jgi:hypothetical protein
MKFAESLPEGVVAEVSVRSLSATAPASAELLPMRGMTIDSEWQPAISWQASRISASPAEEPRDEVPNGWGFSLYALKTLRRLFCSLAEDWQSGRFSTEMVINALAEREVGALN